MKGLAYLLLMVTICVPLWYLGLWIYRRPNIRWRKVKRLTHERDRAIERANQTEEVLDAVKNKIDQYETVDPVLAELLRGTIEQGEVRLKRLQEMER